MPFNVVLVHPEIPTNTGNIGRLCLATNARLHLIKPLGFDLSDRRLKRAGLDYWKHLDVSVYDNFQTFVQSRADALFYFLSAKGSTSYLQIPFHPDDYLIFGKESTGLPLETISKFQKQLFQIPIYDPRVRSLNLANAVGIILYEGLRQLD